MTFRQSSVVVGPALALALTLAQPARAQATREELAAAETTYRQARELMVAGKCVEARPLLETSWRLDPAIGTGLNLGDCLERLGLSASAWTQFTETRALAERLHDPMRRGKEAERRAKLLEARLSKITVHVAAENRGAGLEVRRDGKVVDQGLWDLAIPVDPGEHVIEATRAQHEPFSQKIVVEAKAGTTTVTVPALEALPVEVPTPAAPPVVAEPPKAVDAPAFWTGQRIAGVAMLGLGGAGIVVGAIGGGLAVAKHSSIAKQCAGGLCPAGSEATNEPRINSYDSTALVSTVGFVAGSALAVTGIVLMVTAPKIVKTAAVVPVIGFGYAGAQGSF